MKVVYAGVRHGTCLSRYHSLQKLVPGDVDFFDVDPYFDRMSKWQRAVEWLTFVGPRHTRANADLLKLCRSRRPEVVWIDKSVWVWPSTLRKLRAGGAFLVHHFTDALFPRLRRVHWMFRLLRKTLSLYDLNFTSNIDDHAWMVQHGIRAELTCLGYDSSRFDDDPLPMTLAEKWASGLLFIGHHEPRTERGVVALVDAGLPVTVYGESWQNAKQKERLGGAVQFRPLSDEEYLFALKSAKIGLCWVSELNYNQTAGRSFEIPACGTFLLAMRTNQHLECYREGVEAEFFAPETDELVTKARYYLEHEEKRREIARQGHDRCVRSDYSWERYMRDDWAKVMEAINHSPAVRVA